MNYKTKSVLLFMSGGLILCAIVHLYLNGEIMEHLNPTPKENKIVHTDHLNPTPKENKIVHTDHLNPIPKENSIVYTEHLNPIPKENKVVHTEHLNPIPKENKVVHTEHLNPIPKNKIVHTEHLNPKPKENKIVHTDYLNPTPNAPLQRSLNNNNVPKYIIEWYGNPFTKQPFPDHQVSKTCGNICIVTSNRTMINSTLTGAVIFSFIYTSLQTMPKERNYNQYYVYFLKEGPKYLQVKRPDLGNFDGIFNLTMSYKRNSDIYYPYYLMSEVLQQIKNKYRHTQDSGISSVMKAKKRLAVWIVSNCNYTSGSRKRFKLVEEMVQAGIDIDRRGRCFPNNPPPPGSRQDRGDSKHKEFMASSKFYIAFENSHHCKDYITEKVYENSFLTGSVPIVWGPTKEDYEAVVPPHSCIFMDDFGNNMTKLADYLNYLDKNDTAYKEYLNWRLMDVKDMYGYGVSVRHCRLCEFINGVNNTTVLTSENTTSSLGEEIPRKIVKSLVNWAYNDEERECTRPQ